MTKRISSKDERNAQIAVDYTLGDTAPMLAARYGITKQRIWAILHRHGIKYVKHRISTPMRLRRERDAKIMAAYTAGEPHARICSTYGISAAVLQAIKKRHPEAKTIRAASIDSLNRLCALTWKQEYDAGMTVQAIGRKHHVATSTVHKYLHQFYPEPLRKPGPQRKKKGQP